MLESHKALAQRAQAAPQGRVQWKAESGATPEAVALAAETQEVVGGPCLRALPEPPPHRHS